jgi:peptidoglycan/LPS O-acetylase OafA/YrhL
MFARILVLGIPAFFLVAGASLLSQGKWDTSWTWLVLIGDASYILYLIHPYCEYSIDRILGARHHWLKGNTASGAIIAVSLSVALAILIHMFAERPTVRFLNRNFGGRRKSVEFSTPAS